MPSFKGSGDGYESPALGGNEGDRSPVKGAKKTVAGGKGGAQSGPYEAAAIRTTSPQEPMKSRLSGSGGGPKSGYDNAKIEQDFGFKGHGKGSQGKKVDRA